MQVPVQRQALCGEIADSDLIQFERGTVCPGLFVCELLTAYNFKKMLMALELTRLAHKKSVDIDDLLPEMAKPLTFYATGQLRGTVARALLETAVEQGRVFISAQFEDKLKEMFIEDRCAS